MRLDVVRGSFVPAAIPVLVLRNPEILDFHPFIKAVLNLAVTDKAFTIGWQVTAWKHFLNPCPHKALRLTVADGCLVEIRSVSSAPAVHKGNKAVLQCKRAHGCRVLQRLIYVVAFCRVGIRLTFYAGTDGSLSGTDHLAAAILRYVV